MTARTKRNFGLSLGVILIAAAVFVVLWNAGGRARIATAVPAAGTQQYQVPVAGFELPMVNLEGKWTVKENGTAFLAEVRGNSIKIEMVTSEGVSALYWHGTFKSQESPKAVITSTKTETQDEIVISQSATKEFTIGQDSITFQFSALGLSKNMELHR